MLTKLLIANRGEIACRIIKTARKMGISTVAVYSDADTNALHVQLADEAIHIGAAPSKDSYLQAQKVIDAALKTGADAIHPGYGFLSENAHFATLCKDNNIVFVGPPVAAIEAMGSKSAAKNIMQKAGVPLVPGYHGDDQSEAILKQHSDQMGYPVLLKAAAGGGGKGMRQVWQAEEFSAALAAAKREAMSGFGDDLMLVEKYLTQPRHVEIQVFCDSQGNGVYLFERDCSIQRRHQKVIEEAPAPGLGEHIRQQMGDAALQAAKAIGYVGAGTVEFLFDADGSFYFMEMNTRLQVEHPVTEMISGQDLVEWQLRVAAGEPLPLQQSELKINGHAFEARIYAEDPDNDFLPAAGLLTNHQPPLESAHIRVDTGVRQGDQVSVYYDPMIAKLIVWDEDRNKALQRLSQALVDYRINGVTTNINFLYNLSCTKAFQQADLDTGFIEKHHQAIFKDSRQDIDAALPLAALYLVLAQEQQSSSTHSNSQDAYSPWNSHSVWRANEVHQQVFQLELYQQQYSVSVQQVGRGEERYFKINTDQKTNGGQNTGIGQRQVSASGSLQNDTLIAVVDGHRISAKVHQDKHNYSVFSRDHALHFSHIQADFGLHDDDDHPQDFKAPMNGTVVTLLVSVGDKVEKDQPLLIMEAMKMEHSIKAPTSGTVTEFFFQAGELVDGGTELLSFEANVNIETNVKTNIKAKA